MKRVIRIALLTLASLTATGFAAWASTGGFGGKGSYKKGNAMCVRYDADDPAECIPFGPRGQRGPRGRVGARGLLGLVGPVGIQGPVGAAGPRGAQGIQGVTGPTGPTGPDGAFVLPSGSDPGGAHPGANTIVVLGSRIGPFLVSQGPGKGTILTPSVAQCPPAGPDTEAYDGGAIITTADPSNRPTTNDVVGLASSFTGVDNGPAEVDPLPAGAAPGAVSTEPANAYEAQAVITDVQTNHTVTVQSYVVCGP